MDEDHHGNVRKPEIGLPYLLQHNSTLILIFLPFLQENLLIKNAACPHQGT